jgi:transketolase
MSGQGNFHYFVVQNKSNEFMRHLNEKEHQLFANTIRGLSMDAIQKANSGHPGLPMGMADVATVLWSEFLRFNPGNPKWFNRDRFVLSGGHGSMLLYSLLHLFGYDLSLEDIGQFRQLNSRTPGHPESHLTPGVETTTGPLGQGLANAVGMAIAEAHLSAKFDAGTGLIDHHTYVMAGDGDLQEGLSHEACALAGHLKLGKLILLYDSNGITIDGKTGLSYSDDIRMRFEGYGWAVTEIDGHDRNAIRQAIREAREQKGQPSIIVCRTVIGYGSPNKAGTSGVHGSPLGQEELRLTKEQLGIPPDAFHVPVEFNDLTVEFREEGLRMEREWKENLNKLGSTDPARFRIISALVENGGMEIPEIPPFVPGESMATRKASGKVIEFLTTGENNLLGGSADLTPSNNTFTKNHRPMKPGEYAANYIHYGVREHGMGSVMNGISLHGGLIPYGGTFFVFSDYMRPAIRMAALMEIQVIFVLTHDSIGLGEDGPTHQPVEHLSSIRAMPNVRLFRPMDANETAEAWKLALAHKNGPSCIVLTRQGVPVLDPALYPIHLSKRGGYVLAEDAGFDRIILASGSEVHLALEAKRVLNEKGIKLRVVSMPSTDLFDEQDTAYRNEVLPPHITRRLAIEAGSSLSWYKYTGLDGTIIGLDRFGASGPQKELYQYFGITTDRIVEACQ